MAGRLRGIVWSLRARRFVRVEAETAAPAPLPTAQRSAARAGAIFLLARLQLRPSWERVKRAHARLRRLLNVVPPVEE